ncbi:MAG: hypothetical protein FJZ66_05160, partial [Bacteroidetes bacterium]|nr:hypothetical protein [Bacteroidota bacterium]
MKFLINLVSLVVITGILVFNNKYNAQTYVFAQLTGSPNVNTTGWNLTGSAYTGDTGGDTDPNPNELILT